MRGRAPATSSCNEVTLTKFRSVVYHAAHNQASATANRADRILAAAGNMRGDRHPVRLSAHVDDTRLPPNPRTAQQFRGVLGGDRVTAQLHGEGGSSPPGSHSVGTITKRFTCSTRELLVAPPPPPSPQRPRRGARRRRPGRTIQPRACVPSPTQVRIEHYECRDIALALADRDDLADQRGRRLDRVLDIRGARFLPASLMISSFLRSRS